MDNKEVIIKQAEKILRLEEVLQQYMIDNQTIGKEHAELLVVKEEIEERCLQMSKKLKAIEDEVSQCQYDSVTNFQNKIKSILVSD